MRIGCVAVSIVALLLLAFPGLSDDQEHEIAARALLGEAEKLIELALSDEALPILDQVQAQYPGTEAAVFAGLRRAQGLMFLHSYDDAITQAQQVVSGNPGNIVACWAQCVVGQSLVFKGQVADGIRELWRVQDMLPDQIDLGPTNEAREVLGRVCTQYLEGRPDDVDAAPLLGLDASEPADKAKLLAILAAYRAREGQFEAAQTTLNRLSSECAGQTDEAAWAGAEVAIYCLRSLSKTDPKAGEAAAALDSVCASLPAGHQSGARACLSLGRYYRASGDLDKAITVLRRAINDFANTANAAEVLHDLGHLLLAQNKTADALTAFGQLVADAPRSGYVAPALYAIGTCGRVDRVGAVEALTQLADGAYSRRWRGLAAWKLGDVRRSEDATVARERYEQAIQLFEDCMEQDIADHGDWRVMLAARVEMIRSRIASLVMD